MQEVGNDFGAVWTAAGIVVGFSVTAFMFRIRRELDMRDKGERIWLPVADYVLLTSLAVTLIGVFVLPILGADLPFALYALGLSLVLLAAYPFVLAGHYEILFGSPPEHEKGAPPFPDRERHALWVTLTIVVLYLIAVTVQVVT